MDDNEQNRKLAATNLAVTIDNMDDLLIRLRDCCP